jgi:hypothetical protein
LTGIAHSVKGHVEGQYLQRNVENNHQRLQHLEGKYEQNLKSYNMLFSTLVEGSVKIKWLTQSRKETYI